MTMQLLLTNVLVILGYAHALILKGDEEMTATGDHFLTPRFAFSDLSSNVHHRDMFENLRSQLNDDEHVGGLRTGPWAANDMDRDLVHFRATSFGGGIAAVHASRLASDPANGVKPVMILHRALFSEIGHPAFHSHGLDFHSCVLLCAIP